MLPFDTTVTLEEQGGGRVEGQEPFGCLITPQARADSRGGAHRNFDGLAPLRLSSVLQPNRQLRAMGGTYEGRVFKIVSAVAWEHLPHVELELRASAG